MRAAVARWHSWDKMAVTVDSVSHALRRWTMRLPVRDGIQHINRRHLIQAGLGVGAAAAFAHPFRGAG